jgi:tRNA dimethylallyltransferase
MNHRVSAASGETDVVVIGGPTASGKSALALDLACALNGVVINADSMQLYAELAILTARPSADDLARAPHRLYGVLAAAHPSSVAAWCDMAYAEIARAGAAGLRPIVVGGTGLYLKALIEGLSPIPAIPDHIRAATRELHATLGGEGFHAELARWDPKMARRLDAGDTQRMIRAWEVMVATNRSLADWQAEAPTLPPPGLRFRLLVLDPPRDVLYRACDGRFLAMLDRGAEAEVARLLALDLDPSLPAMKAVGVPELAAFLRGEIGREAAIARAQQATRNLAKRQTTWFRHQRPATGDTVQGCHVATAQYSQTLSCEILPFLRIPG